MLLLVAGNWRIFAFRAAAAVSLAMLVLFWPEPTVRALAALFSGYALADGLATLLLAVRARALPGPSSLLYLAALVRMGAGIVALGYPDIRGVTILEVIAAWALASGIVEIATWAMLRRELANAWPLPAVGALAIAFCAALGSQTAAGALVPSWVLGVYALVLGMLLAAFALRLQALAPEVAGA